MAVGGNQTLEFDIVGPSNQQLIPAFDSQTSINWYVYTDTVQGETALYPYAGSKKVLTFDVGANDYRGRPGGAIETELDAFFVIGPLVFRMDSTFIPVQIGVIGTSTGYVGMEIGGDFLTIVDGSGKWSYNILTDDFQPITDPDAPTSPTDVCQQQGFFLLNTQGSQEIFQSAEDDPTKYDALNTDFINYYSSSLSYPLICIRSINGRVIALTTGFIEVLENEGKAGFTFRPDENLIFGYGTPSASAVTRPEIGGTEGEQQPQFIIFLTDKKGLRKIMMSVGDRPTVISNGFVETKLNRIKNIKNCSCFVWTVNGQTFFQISWTQDNLTLAYCINNKTWFEPQHRGGRHFAESYTGFLGRRLCTSYLNSNLYELSEDYADNDGEPITRERITKNVRIKGYRQFTVRLAWLYAQQGVGLPGRFNANQPGYVYGSTADIEISASFDGGQTFQQPQIVSLGVTAEWQHVTNIENMGTARDFCLKIRTQQPLSRVGVMGCMLDIIPMEGSH